MHQNQSPMWRTESVSPAMSRFPEETPPAMAYVPFQQDLDTYDLENALCAGTLFPVLDKPFTGNRGGVR